MGLPDRAVDPPLLRCDTTLRGLMEEELPLLARLLGDILGLVGDPSFLAVAPCRRAVARVPRTSLGEVTGELETRGLTPAGFGAMAGGTVARFRGGE